MSGVSNEPALFERAPMHSTIIVKIDMYLTDLSPSMMLLLGMLDNHLPAQANLLSGAPEKRIVSPSLRPATFILPGSSAIDPCWVDFRG